VFQTLTACPLRTSLSAPFPRVRLGSGHILVALAATAALALGVVRGGVAPSTVPPVSAAQPVATLVADGGETLAALDASAEALRARLLALPGVGAVALRGVQTAGLEVLYAPARLARLGVREADLRAALPGQPTMAAPGRISLSPAAAQGGPQVIADLPVRAGQRVFRLGDLAAVARTPLRSPVSTLRRGGRPAVEVTVVPARGAAGPALDRAVAASLASGGVN
jgi:multidrug efflux pump subunit AcrB